MRRRAAALGRVAGAGAVLAFWLGPGFTQEPALPSDCAELPPRLDRLFGIYRKAGAAAIDADEPARALEKARARASKGDHEASVTIVGLTLLMAARTDRLSVATIRQICTLGEANGLVLHNLTCAYLTALVPLGEKREKLIATARALARLDGKIAEPLSGGFSGLTPAEAMADRDALRRCLPPQA